MKNYFPSQNQGYQFLQTNRSDNIGSIWASFNLDFQSNLGKLRLSKKLVTNITSSDDADLGLPVAFEYWYQEWWAICGTRIFKNSSPDLVTAFAEETTIGYTIGLSDTQFDVTNPSGTTFRYTYDTTGTNPAITATSVPIGATVVISDTNLAAGNRGTFTVTGSGSNYFEVANAAGVVESNKTISTGYIEIRGGTFGQNYSATQSDICLFNDYLFATTSGNLYYRIADTASVPWQLLKKLNSSSSIHKLVYFKKNDRLYYVDQSSLIASVDTNLSVSTSGDYTLNPGTSIGYVSTMVASSSFIWIGSFRDVSALSSTTNGLEGSISQWDGTSSQAFEYPIKAGGVLAMCVLDDIPYALDTEGRVLKFTGSSFQEIARLPIDRTLLVNATTFSSARFVHFNGMVGTKNNTIQILINNLNDDSVADVTENMPSGVWELDLNTNNFTHKYSPTLKARSSSTVTDFGQNRISAPGALKVNYLQSNNSSGRSTLIAGFNYFSDATTVKSGIFIDSPAKATTDNEGQKRGYFVTTWFESSEVSDIWNRIWITYKKFLNSADKITLKYRTNDEEPTLATITWVDTTHFTTTTDITAYYPTATGFDGTNGGEVEVLQGTGAGACVHITAVSLNAGTYTVTVDNAVTGVTTGTAKARFQKWLKLLPEITGQVLQYGQTAINVADVRIQIKLVMEFTGDDEFHKMGVYSSENLKITP